jgi:formyl-CoA transferase
MRQADAIDAAIQDWVAQRSADTVLQIMRQAEVPAGRIYSIADIVADAQFQARGMLEQHALTDGTPIKLPAVVPRFSATPGGTRWLGPELGAHNREVLHELGLDAEQIAMLGKDGVI